MLKKISITKKLRPWIKNFQDNQNLPVLTESSVVGLNVLEDFLAMAKAECPGCNGIRIHFIRYDTKRDKLTARTPQIKKIANSNFSQVSLAFVPVKNFNPQTLGGEDF